MGRECELKPTHTHTLGGDLSDPVFFCFRWKIFCLPIPLPYFTIARGAKRPSLVN
jgi:hypothetical protein